MLIRVNYILSSLPFKRSGFSSSSFLHTHLKLLRPSPPNCFSLYEQRTLRNANSFATITVSRAVTRGITFEGNLSQIGRCSISNGSVDSYKTLKSSSLSYCRTLKTDALLESKKESSGPSTPPGPNKQQDGKEDDNAIYRQIALGLLALTSVLGALKFFSKPNDQNGGKIYTSKKRTSRHKLSSNEIKRVPSSSDDLPDHIKYLLIGGGTASFSAFRAIKSLDPKAKVLVVAKEPFNPYMRPPLSKELYWSPDRARAALLEFKQWNGTDRSIFYEPEEFYTPCKHLESSENGGVSVAQGWSVERLDVDQKTAVLNDGKKITYEKCLIATGGTPKTIEAFENLPPEINENITFYRGINDFQELEDVIAGGAKSIAIIGGGFLGSELSCSLARRGASENLKVILIFKESGNLSKILPPYLADYTSKKVELEGVQLVKESVVEKVTKDGDKIRLHLNNSCIVVDHVILATGVEPNTQLAGESGLEVDAVNGGFIVNAEMQARSDLYVAGDCASFYDVQFGRRRVEHHDHAVVSGRLAGENMTGLSKPYRLQAMYWSEVGPEVGFEAVGVVDSSLSTVGVFALESPEKDKTSDPNAESNSPNQLQSTEINQPDIGSDEIKNAEYNKGVIFYLYNEIVVGIVLWNLYNKVPIARQVLNEKKKYNDLNEVAKLFAIHG